MKARFSAAPLAMIAVGAALILSGCQSGSGAVAGTAPQEDVAAQVNQDQYATAFAAFSKCVSDAGFPLVNAHLEGKFYDYAITEEGKRAADDCYLGFEAIDTAWQLQNEYDAPTQVALRECLTQAGVKPGPDVATVWKQLEEAKIDPVDCVEARVR